MDVTHLREKTGLSEHCQSVLRETLQNIEGLEAELALVKQRLHEHVMSLKALERDE
jgi:hypothetical protein